jgi:hypothetical protein
LEIKFFTFYDGWFGILEEDESDNEKDDGWDYEVKVYLNHVGYCYQDGNRCLYA